MHEAQMHRENCVVALTYERGKLPPNSSLCHKDYQDFMKRLRWLRKIGIRYSMCGEYGEENGRPHYHACLFGIDFQDREYIGKSKSGAPMYNSAELRKIWGHGNVSVQDLCRETAGYVHQYIMKKQLGTDEHTGVPAKDAYNIVQPDGKVLVRTPPYARSSLGTRGEGGIGKKWWEKYGISDAVRHDRIVTYDGREHPVPKYYDKLLKRLDEARLQEIKSNRVENAGDFRVDNTRARLDAREIVHIAKMSKHKRNM